MDLDFFLTRYDYPPKTTSSLRTEPKLSIRTVKQAEKKQNKKWMAALDFACLHGVIVNWAGLHPGFIILLDSLMTTAYLYIL